MLAPALTEALVHELRTVAFLSISYDASNKGNAKMLPIAVQYFSKFGVKRGILDFIEQSDESAVAMFENIKYVLDEKELTLDQLVSLGSDNTNVNVGNHHSVFTLFEKLSPRLIKGEKDISIKIHINNLSFIYSRNMLFTCISQFCQTCKRTFVI